MSAVDEARALLAATAAAEDGVVCADEDSDGSEFAVLSVASRALASAAPRVLAALCDEVDALRAEIKSGAEVCAIARALVAAVEKLRAENVALRAALATKGEGR